MRMSCLDSIENRFIVYSWVILIFGFLGFTVSSYFGLSLCKLQRCFKEIGRQIAGWDIFKGTGIF